MAKTYILEPMELTTINTPDGSATNISATDELSAALLLIDSSSIAEVSGIALKYAGTMGTSAIFTPDGSLPAGETPPEHFLAIIPQNDIIIFSLSEPAGTYTVSIYTESEDPEPEPTPSGSLTPITRKEMYLSAIAGLTTLPSGMEPVTREEMYLDAILNGTSASVNAVTREEMYLDEIANNKS